MYARGYTASNDGNISVRVGDDRLLMTPKSVCKGFMTPDMMCVTDLDGKKIQGDRDPSSEMLMHLEVYRQRPDVKAVVHAHPPTATGFAVAGIPLDRAVLAEVLTTLGSIPLAEYATPSTAELPEAVRKYIKAHDGMLLANHGALTVGGDLFSRVLQDGNDRALREDQPGRAHARRREPDFARRGHAPAGAARDLRHQGAGADLPGPGRARTVRTGRGGRHRRPDDATCQTVQAPAGTGMRLVPDLIDAHRRASGEGRRAAGDEAEIRLTYRELSALIEDAIRSLR